MKKYNVIKLLIFSAMAGFLLNSCSKEFLEKSPTEFISADKIAEISKIDPSIQNSNISGLYSTMVSMWTGGTKGHDDFGQKGYDIYTDMLCADMVLAGYNYGWYSNLVKFRVTTDYTKVGNYKPWRYYYRIINGANLVIDGLGGTDAVPELKEGKELMGQAKAMRAYAYFYLISLYSKDYSLEAKVLPIYTSLKQPSQPQSTNSDVFALIKSDLEVAVDFLSEFSRTGKHEVDKSVAQSLLAYTYLTLGEYDKAISTAQDVINSGGFSILPYDNVTTTGFNDVSDPSWIWGFDLTLDQGLDLVSWWGQVDLFTYSYAWAGDGKTMDEGLYESIRPTDERKYQFTDLQGFYYPIGKFYAPTKPKVGGQREITTDYVYMRIEEMYLIKAEAEAFSGNDGAASATLKQLVSQRDSDPDYVDALSGQELKDEIYHQWRLELWGEGKSYLAMKRNKATIERKGHLEFNGEPIPYNDERLTFEIPEKEIQDNPFINK